MKMPRKKLFLFVPSLIAGGAERVAMLLASGFVALGHEVYLLVARDTGEFQKACPDAVQVIDLACGKPIKGISRLADQIQRHRPDACIAFGIQAGIAAGLSKSIHRWSAELLIRNENNLQREWLGAMGINRVIGPLLSRWVARRYGLVCVSEALSQATQGYLRLSQDQVTTIINPVFADDMPAPVESGAVELHRWLEDDGPPTFVAMGRLEHQKGFDLLLDAFGRVIQQTDARLIVFGNGSLRQSLLDQAVALSMADKVAFPGFTACPIEQMRRSTAFVLSSRFEGFGLVLVEALMSGTQVVSTDCDCGPAEVLEGGRYGHLVAPEDPQALADGMLACIRAPAKPVPSAAWFQRFSADMAARRHLAWLDGQNVRE
ncbi:MAG TPA: glycosyltransferase [Burkholderiaceae bacterium]|nr:glycosyltransferase [Burkholderiaceae bacterium]